MSTAQCRVSISVYLFPTPLPTTTGLICLSIVAAFLSTYTPQSTLPGFCCTLLCNLAGLHTIPLNPFPPAPANQLMAWNSPSKSGNSAAAFAFRGVRAESKTERVPRGELLKTRRQWKVPTCQITRTLVVEAVRWRRSWERSLVWADVRFAADAGGVVTSCVAVE